VTNISQEFYLQDGEQKLTGIDMEENYVSVILCIPVYISSTFNGLFSRTTWASRYQNSKISLDLNEARDNGVLGWQWHQLDRMQTICTSIQADNHINTSSLIFTGPDAFPDAQPTV